jgi:DNA polymerase V
MPADFATATILGTASPEVISHATPLFGCRVRAGFPSPADDHLDTDIDLHAHVVTRPAATFFVRAEGDSMNGDGIHDGDLLVVDRSLEPLPGRVLIVALNGELTVKRLEHLGLGQHPCLTASNPRYRPIPLMGQDAEVWGVVTHVVHALGGGPS